jgi:hydrogenase maturation protease
MSKPNRILVIGYGNPGRCDDGLGPALSDKLERLHVPGLTVESAFQLSIEHADLAAKHDIVVFADAATDLKDDAPFYLRRIEPSPERTHFAHSVPPEAVLHLAEQCFGARPTAWVLGIRPVDLETFGEGLTLQAGANLEAALAALLEAIRSGGLDKGGLDLWGLPP